LNNANVLVNRKYLEYSMEKKIDIDVDIERFENQTYSGLRNTMVKFVMGGGKESRLRDFVI
jgi:hypothetical protein